MVSRFLGRKCRVYGPELIMEALEERIVLDASVSAVPNDHATNSTATDPQTQTSDQSGQTSDAGNAAAPAAAPDPAQEVFSQNLHVVLVSNALDRIDAVSAAALEDAHVIEFDAQKDNLSTINVMLHDLSQSTGQKIGALAIVGHGDEGLVQIGADQISSSNLFKFVTSLQALASDLSQDAQIQFYGCSVAESAEGRELIDQIAFYTHADVFASSNDTGGNLNDWTLEYGTDVGAPLVQLFNLENLPSDGSTLLYPGRAPLDSLTTCYQYYSALDSGDLRSVIFGQTSYSETWIFTLTATTNVSIGMQTIHPEWTHGHAGFVDCWLDFFPYQGTEPVASTRITYNDDWGTPGDMTHAPVYSGNDALIYNYTLAAGTYCIQATHWSEPVNQPQYNLQTGGYYLLSSVPLDYWVHNNSNAPISTGIPDPPDQPQNFSPNYVYDISPYFSDPQGDTLTYEFGTIANGHEIVYSTVLDGLTIDPATGLITFTSQTDSTGSVDVWVRAFDPNDYDGNLYSQFQKFTFSVCPEKQWYAESCRDWVPTNGTTEIELTGHAPAGSSVSFEIDDQYIQIGDQYTLRHGTLTRIDGAYADPTDASTYHQKFTYTPNADYYGEDAFQFKFQVLKGNSWEGIEEGSQGLTVGGRYDTSSVQFGDLNNDGFVDIVEGVNSTTQYSRYYLNDGHGNFSGTGSRLGTATDLWNTTSIQLGDVNGDGWLDIVAGNTGAQYDKVYINPGYDLSFFDANGNRVWQGFQAVVGIDVPGSNVGTRYSIALGDLDGDGDLDLVAGRADDNLDRIYLNNGMGQFSGPDSIAVPVANQGYTYAVALGDLDGDGDLDVVAGKYDGGSGSRGIDFIYLNNGSGTFTARQLITTTPTNDNTMTVKLGDLDNDGNLDIVTGNYNQNNRVYINDGEENPTFTNNPIGNRNDNTRSIDLGDLDRDGDLDLIVGNYNEANRYYLNPAGTGSFTTNGFAFSNNYYTCSVDLADVNWDGTLDLIVGNNRDYQSGGNSEYNRIFYNEGFSGAVGTWRMTEPGDVRINVSLMENPSFEDASPTDHSGGYYGWNLTTDPNPEDPFVGKSTFAVVENKQKIGDMSYVFDHHTGEDVLQWSFGLPLTVKDKTADTTEDIAVLLGTGARHVTLWQDVEIPANTHSDHLDLKWRMSYQNEYGLLDPDNAFDDTTRYIAVYVYDPSQPRPDTPTWITTQDVNPVLIDSLRDFSVNLDSVVSNSADVTVRVEFEVMIQDYWFMEVTIDDVRFVPTPPGSVTPGPLLPDSGVDMGIAAVVSPAGNSSALFAMSYTFSQTDSSQESSAIGSTTGEELELTLLKVLEGASQTPVPLSTVTSETEASGANEASSGTPAPQPVETSAVSGQTVGTVQTATNQAPQVQTALSGLPTVESSYQSNPVSAPSQDGTAPAPETGLSPDLSTAIGPVSTETGDGNLLLSTEFALEPAMALVFNLEKMSAWDVVNSQAAAIAGSGDAGLAQELAVKLSFGNSFVADLDSLRLTEILA